MAKEVSDVILDDREFIELRRLVLLAEQDAEKFFHRGNRAAGVRFRKKMMEANRLAKSVRATVSAINKERSK